MLIPYKRLEADTLQNLIEDFVSREGTDNGDDSTEEQKVALVRTQLATGQAVIYFDAEHVQCILTTRDLVPDEMLLAWSDET